MLYNKENGFVVDIWLKTLNSQTETLNNHMWCHLLQGKGKYIVTVIVVTKNSVRTRLSLLLYPVCQYSHHN